MERNYVAQDLLTTLSKGDIIEIPRWGFCHYAFYLGDGVIVHVTKKGNYDSAVSAEQFMDIVGMSPARLNNFEGFAKQLGLTRRPIHSAIEIATNGLEKDSSGNVVVGAYNNFNYNFLYNNCEIFATYCKYECPGGWSEQAMNMWKAVVGGISTLTTQLSGNVANSLIDNNVSVPDKILIGAITPLYMGMDIATATLSTAFTPVSSTMHNITRGGAVVSEERESEINSYSSLSSSGASAQTSRESREAHWSVFSAGAAGPSAGARAHAGFDGIAAEAKAELARAEVGAGPCKFGVGLQADTGVCVQRGKVGASLLGFGAEVGSDGLKIKTPLADAACCVM